MEQTIKNDGGPTVRLDALQYKNRFIYQQEDMPCFTQDSVLLSAFADLSEKDMALDIGAGTGVLAILNNARTGASFCCIEREERLCGLLLRSIAYNGINNITVKQLDWADAPAELGYGAFTAALCNPPYFERGTRSPQPLRTNARGYENALQSAVQAAGKLLKRRGKFYLCYPASGLDEALFALRDARFSVKRLRLVAYQAHKPPYLALVMAAKDGGPGLSILPALILKDGNGEDTQEAKQIYHKV